MFRLFLGTLMCSLNSYSVTTLGSDGYAYLAHCVFTSNQSMDLYNEYRYNDTILTKVDPLKMEYTLSIYTDIYYTDFNTYRIKVKSVQIQSSNLYYYNSSTYEWNLSTNNNSPQIITFGNDGYSWTNNSNPDNIALYSTIVDNDPLYINTSACYYYDGNISYSGITNNDVYQIFYNWEDVYSSLTFLNTYTDYDLYKTYYLLDYDMFYNGLRMLVGADSTFNDGYSIGYNEGVNVGYDNGYDAGYDNGYDVGYDNGFNVGYDSGYNEGATQDETATAIMSGIVSIGFIPINFFLAIFNWEVFGINIAGFVSSILSVCVLIIIIKHVFSTKGD